jgi:hypothetical protein
MPARLHDPSLLEPATRAFYCEALDLLAEGHLPFLLGGAYALERYTGITRHTKDLDVFVRRQDSEDILEAFARAGYQTERTFPHWLGKVYRDGNVLDVIHSSGNGVVEVDDEWFHNAVEGIVLERTVLLTPAEETIWSKAFVMERERFDGADINHLLRACADTLDWDRLLRRFDPDWHLLLAHLILFSYVYPAEARRIPDMVLWQLVDRLQRERSGPVHIDPLCRGPLLSRAQYLIDIREWDYRDPRLPPWGKMTPEQIDLWTAAIGIDNPALERS